jgi:F-type H+-transporting ATPase subunit epsilon
MHLEIITPETKIFTGEVDAVSLPGLDGWFQVLKGHAPIISALGKGKVKVDLPTPFERSEKSSEMIEGDQTDSKVIRVSITGGVMEMQNNKIVLLAE